MCVVCCVMVTHYVDNRTEHTRLVNTEQGNTTSTTQGRTQCVTMSSTSTQCVTIIIQSGAVISTLYQKFLSSENSQQNFAKQVVLFTYITYAENSKHFWFLRISSRLKISWYISLFQVMAQYFMVCLNIS